MIGLINILLLHLLTGYGIVNGIQMLINVTIFIEWIIISLQLIMMPLAIFAMFKLPERNFIKTASENYKKLKYSDVFTVINLLFAMFLVAYGCVFTGAGLLIATIISAIFTSLYRTYAKHVGIN